MKKTPQSGLNPEPSGGWIAIPLFLASLLVYLATLSRAPFPGAPARLLRAHLGMTLSPPSLDGWWGLLVRWADRVPGVSPAEAMGLFSAVCGAACVALAAAIMQRVRYLGLFAILPEQEPRERNARRYSAITAGMYLAACIPFWVAATRSLPATFQLLWLLLTVWFFSEYQRTGRGWTLLAGGWLYGSGLSISPTFLLYLPVAVALLAREWFRRRKLADWRVHLAWWGGALAGGALYPVQAWMGLRGEAGAAGLRPVAAASLRIFQAQFRQIADIRFNAGFAALMFFAVAPWLLLFVLSRRSPWYYDLDQILVRHVFSWGLLAVLFNAPFAFWNFLGMQHLLLTPHLLLAVCCGYMAGELWIVGGCTLPSDASWFRRLVRRWSGWMAPLMPVLALVAGARNLPIAQGRTSHGIAAIARETIARLDGRDILFSNDIMEDVLQLTAREQGVNVRFINAQSMFSPRYLAQLAAMFSDPVLQSALRAGAVDQFIETLLLDEAGIRRVAVLDLPEYFREFAYLVPDGLIYRLEPEAPRDISEALQAAQASLRNLLEPLLIHAASEGNPVYPYQQGVRSMAAKMANNIGVRLAETGDEPAAQEAFRMARSLDPRNLSALLNLLDALLAAESPEADEMERELEYWQERITGTRWALAMRSGYVWRAREWVHRGWSWALSGEPQTVEGVRRQVRTFDARHVARTRFLDLAYLRLGLRPREEIYYQTLLARNERDTDALLELVRLALLRNDPDGAEAFIAEALEKGVAAERVEFDRAMAAYVRGHTDEVRTRLLALMRTQPGNMRVWMAMRLLTTPGTVLHQRALDSLQAAPSADVPLRLGLAWLLMADYQWDEAYRYIEAAIQQDPRNPVAWEMMATLAQIQGRPRLLQTSRQTLLAMSAQHPLQVIYEAQQHADNREWLRAETMLSDGIHRRRQPDLLVVLASLFLQQRIRLDEARALLDEAILLQPFHPHYRLTRAQLHFMTGDAPAAIADVGQALNAMPNYAEALLFDVHLRLATGDPAAGRSLDELVRLRDTLSPSQQARLDRLVHSFPSP